MSHCNSIAGAVRRTCSRREGASCVISCREQGSSSLGQCLARCAYTGFWKSPLTLGTEGACTCVSFSCSLVPVWITTVFWHIPCAQDYLLNTLRRQNVMMCMNAWHTGQSWRRALGSQEHRPGSNPGLAAACLWSWSFYFCELYFPQFSVYHSMLQVPGMRT